MTVVTESSASSCKVAVKIFPFMKQMSYFGLKFQNSLCNFSKKIE